MTALVAAFDVKAFNDTELLTSLCRHIFVQCVCFFLWTDKKRQMNLIKNLGHVFCQLFKCDVFGCFACKN